MHELNKYFDYAASCPIDLEVINTMVDEPQNCGNPSSEHSMGIQAKNIIDISRETILNALNVRHGKIIFTSGATEANNLATHGASNFTKKRKNHYYLID